MKISLSAVSGRSCGAMLLALTITWLPGVSQPQKSDAQTTGKTRGRGIPGRGKGRGLPGKGSGRGIPGTGGGLPRTSGGGLPATSGGGLPHISGGGVGNTAGAGKTTKRAAVAQAQPHDVTSVPVNPPVAAPVPIVPVQQAVTAVVPETGVHSFPFRYTRAVYTVSGPQWYTYFPTATVYYPHYVLAYNEGISAFSPFGYYYNGVSPVYITQSDAVPVAPPTSYVPTAAYTDGVYQGNQGDDANTYYLKQPQNQGQNDAANAAPAKVLEPLLKAAIADITATWQQKDIHFLTKHIHITEPVAVYLKGKYYYSLKGENYINITRDALATIKTVTFALEKIQPKGNDIYAVSGRHTYTDRQGKDVTVMVTYVLKKVDDYYYIIQLDTAPEKLNP
jgi:hypothetical protein